MTCLVLVPEIQFNGNLRGSHNHDHTEVQLNIKNTLKYTFSLSVPNVKLQPKANGRFSPTNKTKPNNGIDQVIVLEEFKNLFRRQKSKKLQGLKQKCIIFIDTYEVKIEI